MNQKQLDTLKKAYSKIRIKLDEIGYESLFMIKNIESGTCDTNATKDCLVRINNLAQKAHRELERQESTIDYFI